METKSYCFNCQIETETKRIPLDRSKIFLYCKVCEGVKHE